MVYRPDWPWKRCSTANPKPKLIEASFTSGCVGEVHLPPCFIYHHGNGIGKVETSAVGNHGHAETSLCGEALQYMERQAARLGPKHKYISANVRPLVIALFS